MPEGLCQCPLLCPTSGRRKRKKVGGKDEGSAGGGCKKEKQEKKGKDSCNADRREIDVLEIGVWYVEDWLSIASLFLPPSEAAAEEAAAAAATTAAATTTGGGAGEVSGAGGGWVRDGGGGSGQVGGGEGREEKASRGRKQSRKKSRSGGYCGFISGVGLDACGVASDAAGVSSGGGGGCLVSGVAGVSSVLPTYEGYSGTAYAVAYAGAHAASPEAPGLLDALPHASSACSYAAACSSSSSALPAARGAPHSSNEKEKNCGGTG